MLGDDTGRMMSDEDGRSRRVPRCPRKLDTGKEQLSYLPFLTRRHYVWQLMTWKSEEGTFVNSTAKEHSHHRKCSEMCCMIPGCFEHVEAEKTLEG